jgi:hypothetical protein
MVSLGNIAYAQVSRFKHGQIICFPLVLVLTHVA